MKAKRFCETCGSLMVKKVRPLNRYDTYTGNRESAVDLRCPNYRWYKLGHWKLTLTSEFEMRESDE